MIFALSLKSASWSMPRSPNMGNFWIPERRGIDGVSCTLVWFWFSTFIPNNSK